MGLLLQVNSKGRIFKCTTMVSFSNGVVGDICTPLIVGFPPNSLDNFPLLVDIVVM